MKRTKSLMALLGITFLMGCATQRDWESATQRGTVDAYSEFIAVHPSASQVPLARAKVMGLEWEAARKTNTEEGFLAFTKKYPYSEHKRDARDRIEAIRTEQMRRDWGETKQANTAEAYQKFISQYASSPYVSEAKRLLAERKAEAERRALAKSFEVTTCRVRNRVPLMRSLSYVVTNPFGNTMTEGESDRGMAEPAKGEVFVELSWRIVGFTPSKGFTLPPDMLSLRSANGTSLQPTARAQWATEHGLFWYTHARVIYDDPDLNKITTAGGPATQRRPYRKSAVVEETWLFSVPKDAIGELQYDCLGRTGPLPVQTTAE